MEKDQSTEDFLNDFISTAPEIIITSPHEEPTNYLLPVDRMIKIVTVPSPYIYAIPSPLASPFMPLTPYLEGNSYEQQVGFADFFQEHDDIDTLMNGLGNFENLVQSTLEDQNVHQMDTLLDFANVFKPTTINAFDLADLFQEMDTSSKSKCIDTDASVVSGTTLVDQSLLDQLKSINRTSSFITKKSSQLNMKKSNLFEAIVQPLTLPDGKFWKRIKEEGVVRYRCPYDMCEKSFTRPQNLKSHYLSHTGECPFACLECGRKFRRNNDLKRHRNNVHCVK